MSGICVHNGKVLLQKSTNDNSYAFPGGHVEFGETNEETLTRVFKEEMGANITVLRLLWVGENFFPCGKRMCHQICLYYLININSNDVLKKDVFVGNENMENKKFSIEFDWLLLESLKDNSVYPTNTVELMNNLDSDVQHFVYKEDL